MTVGTSAQGITSTSWHQVLPASGRFMVLSAFGDEAVLDRETGLVWERAPSSSLLTFHDANRRAQHLRTGGRMGWRMPRVEELFSLLDPTQINSFGLPALPAGHPFQGVMAGIYWLKERAPSPPAEDAMILALAIDAALVQEVPPSTKCRVWCTRGPGGAATPGW
jgi:hypothetical protein